MKILGIVRYRIVMRNKIQLNHILICGVLDGVLYIRSQREWQPQRPVSHRERRQGCVELELA